MNPHVPVKKEKSPTAEPKLIHPHGGQLVNRCMGTIFNGMHFDGLPKIPANADLLMDLEQIGIGTFSPIEGFFCRHDYECVLDHMRLSNGIVWTIPIVLPIDDRKRNELKKRDIAAISNSENGEVVGIIEIEEIYPYNREEYSQKIFGTTESGHPGVRQVQSMGAWFVGGKVRLRRKYDEDCGPYKYTPEHARDHFRSLGWSKVVGFHTRNVIHRSHEFIQLEALRRSGCDGLLVHPIVGRKKAGDYTADTIIRSYEMMMDFHYPKDRVAFSVFHSYSRYAGPREAIFTALCRKNYGCSHFIVGRDHTGVGNYYPPTASQEIFGRFDDLGIEPIFFGEIGYAEELNRYVDIQDYPGNKILHISATEAREMLKLNIMPPEWFMRPDISRFIMDKIAGGDEVFIS